MRNFWNSLQQVDVIKPYENGEELKNDIRNVTSDFIGAIAYLMGRCGGEAIPTEYITALLDMKINGDLK